MVTTKTRGGVREPIRPYPRGCHVEVLPNRIIPTERQIARPGSVWIPVKTLSPRDERDGDPRPVLEEPCPKRDCYKCKLQDGTLEYDGYMESVRTPVSLCGTHWNMYVVRDHWGRRRDDRSEGLLDNTSRKKEGGLSTKKCEGGHGEVVWIPVGMGRCWQCQLLREDTGKEQGEKKQKIGR